MIARKNNRPFLEMRRISKRFGATVALDDVSFSVDSGEVHALVGENGAGKSTLMKILSGAHQPDGGDIVIGGKPYLPRGPMDGRRLGIGMIYQELSLAPHLTVAENIVLGMEPARFGFLRRAEIRKAAENALNHFNHPEIACGARVGDLSTGAKQLVEIGRALAVGCRVLVFDEPTSSLTQKDSERLFELIRRLRDRGLAIVYISHFLEEVQRIADRLTVLRNGSVAGTADIRGLSRADVVCMMVGRAVRDLYPRSPRKKGEPVFEIENLSGRTKPESVSLVLHAGEILGIFGLVGAGRTELLRAAFGLEPARSGRVRAGVFSGPAKPADQWRHGIGLLSEDRKEEGIALGMSVADNMTLSKMENLGCGGFILPKNQSRAARKWIDALSIRCVNPEQSVAGLSGGNQQKVALGRLLHHGVDILLLDEPTRGIDVASKAKIYEVMDSLAAGGKAVLMVSSYMPELLGVCDRIAVMCRGRLVAARPVGEWNEHRLMLAATGEEECGVS